MHEWSAKAWVLRYGGRSESARLCIFEGTFSLGAGIETYKLYGKGAHKQVVTTLGH